MPISNFICRWNGCKLVYDNVEALFDHLSDDHVGRRSTNNLCLTCSWNDCGATAAKRDHLTSHIKIHLPFKPYICLKCRKNFKRPQDLKKHERIHTIEHQASLLSNQPGYKPVRRRRTSTTILTGTKGIKDTNPTIIGLPTSPAPPVSVRTYYSAMNKDVYGSCSGILPGNNTSTGTIQAGIQGGISNDMDRAPTTSASLYEHKTCTNNRDPLDDFLQHALKDDCPPPEYDIDMMQRLNTISYVMQQKQNDFILPLSKPNEINALQTWLEQLSANIQTNNYIYPDTKTLPTRTHSQHHDLTMLTDITNSDTAPSQNNVSHLLYPSCEIDVSNNANSTNRHQASNSWLLTSSSLSSPTCTNTLLSVSSSTTNTLTTTPSNISNDNHREISPLFWKPGPTASTSTVEIPAIDGHAPSEEIDFSPEHLQQQQQQQQQPTIHFETDRNDVEHVGVPNNKLDISFEDKKEIMQMINVFASPTQKTKDSTIRKVDHNVDDTVCDNLTDDSIDTTDLKATSTTSSSVETTPQPTVSISASEMMTLASPKKFDTTTNSALSDDDDNRTSPYADLVDLLQNVSLKNENVDGKLRERHAQVVDLLWRATLRTSTRPTLAPLLSKSSSSSSQHSITA